MKGAGVVLLVSNIPEEIANVDNIFNMVGMYGDVMFVKQYPVYPERRYNEVAGLTASVWYPEHARMCELEPIGPAEQLASGESASFTETWWLVRQKFPAEGADVDLKQVQKTVDGL